MVFRQGAILGPLEFEDAMAVLRLGGADLSSLNGCHT